MDLPGSLSLLEPEPEGKERSLEQDLSKVLISEEFELEGVCQLPDQSPPKDSASVTEETSWGQFGLGRKRFLSAKEESEYKVKRVCDSLRKKTDSMKLFSLSLSLSLSLARSLAQQWDVISCP